MSTPFAKYVRIEPMSGQELQTRRKALKMSQDELARVLGVTRQSVYMWERGKTATPLMLDYAMHWIELQHRGERDE